MRGFQFLWCFVFASLPLGNAFADQSRPDVLFIAIDDLNDWIGCLGGHPQTHTPNIDRLASQGILFTNAHCAAPACNPSRAALMTGRAPWRSGIYHNPQPWRPAMPDAVTISQHFMASGYWAGGSGKIFHGAYADPKSWVEYFPSLKKQSPPGAMPKNKNQNGIPKSAHFDWGPMEAETSEMSDFKVAEWVSNKLREKRNSGETRKPRFLACGIYRPHLPWYAPRKYFDASPKLNDIELPAITEDDLADVPAAGVKIAKPQGDHAKVLKHDQWSAAVRGYLASVRFADEMVGKVMQALEDSGRKQSTIVVLWTDHGWHLGEKQHWRKFALWERATKVPVMMIVPEGVSKALPQGSTAGSRCDRPVSLLDLYPTLSDLCGLPQAPGPLDGQSLVGLIRDPKSQPDRTVVTTHGRNNHAVRHSRWRYIRYADGSEELYDHASDPNEWKNLAVGKQHGETIAMLRKRLPKMNVPEAPKDKKK